jgi:hypothetical protein
MVAKWRRERSFPGNGILGSAKRGERGEESVEVIEGRWVGESWFLVRDAEAVAGVGKEKARRRKNCGKNGFEKRWTDNVFLLDQGASG